MITYVDEIEASINDIEILVAESEINVITSMLDSYHKIEVIQECHQNDDTNVFDIFQEGERWEAIKEDVKEQGKDMSKIEKAVTLLFRLIRSIIRSFQGKLKKEKITEEKAKEVVKDIEGFESEIAKLSNADRQARIDQINQYLVDDEQIVIDEKTGKLKFKKQKRWELTFGFLIAAGMFLMRVSKELDITNSNNIQNYIRECEDLIKNKKKPDARFLDSSLVSTVNMAMLATSSVSLLSSFASGANNILRNKNIEEAIKDYPSSEKQKTLGNIQKLVNGCQTLANKCIPLTNVLSYALPLYMVLGPFIKQLISQSDFIKKQYEAMTDDERLDIINKQMTRYKSSTFKNIDDLNATYKFEIQQRIAGEILTKQYKETEKIVKNAIADFRKGKITQDKYNEILKKYRIDPIDPKRRETKSSSKS